MPEFLINLIIIFSKIGFVLTVLLTGVAYSVYAERRVSAFIQNRYGPNRVGPQGLLQPLVDVVKLLMKEDIVPEKANKFIHSLAPTISIIVSLPQLQ